MGKIVRGRIVLKTGMIIPMSSKLSPLKVLGERIRELRKVKNLTQEDLAYESDIVHQPDFAVARVHLPSRMSNFSCSTSRVGRTSAQFSCARWRSRNFM